ncbi:MAG: hypothetical protein M9894_33230 [Planctomycetes bacterium]|nr:hypothetical protein [Planctomycetota bacterium]
MATSVTVACEGDGDVPIARKLLEHVGLAMGSFYPADGKGNLDRRLKAYNNAAKHTPWLVLRDLDVDADCAPMLVATLLPSPSSQMSFRVAVRAAEAWLMADRERFATFFGVPLAKVPRDPESLRDPKTEVVNLARRSRIKDIRESVPVQQGMSGRVGTGYTEKIVAFATDHWRPEVAAGAAPSLAACVERLRKLPRGA